MSNLGRFAGLGVGFRALVLDFRSFRWEGAWFEFP